MKKVIVFLALVVILASTMRVEIIKDVQKFESNSITQVQETAPSKQVSVESPIVEVGALEVEVEVKEEKEEIPYNVADEISFRPDYEGLIDETIGWILIPSLDLSLPICQGEDNVRFLKENAYGQSDERGVPALDSTLAADFSDQWTIVYGHNWNNTSVVFSQLQNAEANMTVYLFIRKTEEVRKFKLVSAHLGYAASDRVVRENWDPSYLLGLKGSDLVEVAEWARENAYLASDIEVNEDSNVLVLSTCFGGSDPSVRRILHLVEVFE